MNNEIRVVAEKFSFYNKLSLVDRWGFRRSLKWVSQDQPSLDLLMDFEKKQQEKSLFWWQTFGHIQYALRWYNREDHDDRIQDRLPRDRLPELLQLVLFFIARTQKLNFKYRDLFLNIIRSGDALRMDSRNNSTVTPGQFHLEAAELICNLNDKWHSWDSWYPKQKNDVDQMLGHFADIAAGVNDPKLFIQFRLQAEKISKYGWWALGEKVGYLENIAGKVNDLQCFTQVFQEIVPATGLELASSLAAISKDFQEFEACYRRVAVQIEFWGSEFRSVFNRQKTAAELDQLLVFLETMGSDPRMQKCARYHESKNPKGLILSLKPFTEVREVCSGDTWKDESSIDNIIYHLTGIYVQNIVNLSLNAVWGGVSSGKVRWEFNSFTEYVPYEKRTLDWTLDNEETRRYWNWQNGLNDELNRFKAVLGPRLWLLFDELESNDYDALIQLLPGYISFQEFTKTVNIPVEWEMRIEYREGYDRWAGFYDQKVEVGQPKAFIKHTFTFDRPYLQEATGLLDDPDKTRLAIQADKIPS